MTPERFAEITELVDIFEEKFREKSIVLTDEDPDYFLLRDGDVIRELEQFNKMSEETLTTFEDLLESLNLVQKSAKKMKISLQELIEFLLQEHKEYDKEYDDEEELFEEEED